MDALATCHVLAELTAAANMLRQWPLPQAPGSLAALTCLDLSQNPIESVPAGAFAAAPGLLQLDLSGIAAAAALAAPPVRSPHTGGLMLRPTSINPTHHLQMGLAAVPGLQELRLANCRLRAFPPGVGGRPRRKLYKFPRRFCAILRWIKFLAPCSVRVLDVESNKIPRALRFYSGVHSR